MKNMEIETKYYADNISLSAFQKFCEDRRPLKFLSVSGFDYFYSNNDEPGSFCRQRVGPDRNEFTYKRKTSDSNNIVRKEINIRLENGESAEALADAFGYQYNTKVFKTCFIYIYDSHTFVYYICFDADMREIGRFVEIEVREDYQWTSQEEAWNQLVVLEKLCKPLGVTPQARVKRSLFELYKK